MAGGYTPWEWLTGRPLVNAAGEAVGSGQIGPDGAIWNWPRSGSNWGPTAQAKAYPYVNPSMPPVQEAARQSSQRIHKEKEEDRRIHEQVLETDRVQTANAKSYDALHYPQAQYMQYQGKRDPFKPLPGMKRNPDPNADPFKGGGGTGAGGSGEGGGGSMGGFSDPMSDHLLGLIQGYDQFRAQGQTREMALTSLHYQPPQPMMGGGGTGGSGGGEIMGPVADSGGPGSSPPPKPSKKNMQEKVENPHRGNKNPNVGDMHRRYERRQKILKENPASEMRAQPPHWYDGVRGNRPGEQGQAPNNQRDEKLADRRIQLDGG